jgi:hypothetical protein
LAAQDAPLIKNPPNISPKKECQENTVPESPRIKPKTAEKVTTADNLNFINS